MLVVMDQIGLDLSVNGTNIPLGPDSFESVSVFQNMHSLVGTAQVNIIDVRNYFSQGLFADGAKVSIALGPAVQNQNPYPNNFLLFNIQEATPTAMGTSLKFSCMQESPGIFRKTMTKAYKGTSSSVITQMGQEVGVNVSTTGTSDNQTWLPNNRPYGQAMRKIADHGHGSSTSAMHLAMGTNGQGQWSLMYKDVIQQLQNSASRKFVSLEGFKGDGYPVLSCKFRTHSGTLNNQFAYGGAVMQTKMDGKTVIDKAVEAIQSSASLNVSSAIKGVVGELSKFIMPTDVKNVHDNYSKALLQNEKLKATLSVFVEVVTHYYTDLAIMDPVDLVITNGTDINRAVSGRYVVHSRTQHISSRTYREKLVLAAQGFNTN